MSYPRTISPQQLAEALGSTDCLPPARLAAAVAGELTEADRAAVFAHASGCDACGAELELAAAFAPPASGSAEQGEVAWIVEQVESRRAAGAEPQAALGKVLPMRPAKARISQTPPRWALAAAASLLLAVGGFFLINRPGVPPIVPTPISQDVVRSAALEWQTPLGRCAELPSTLAWSANDRAVRYHLEARHAATRELLWQGESEATSLPFPAALAARLTPFTSVELQVRALGADGSVVALSPLAELRLEPKR